MFQCPATLSANPNIVVDVYGKKRATLSKLFQTAGELALCVFLSLPNL